jgi:hypothetical protein
MAEESKSGQKPAAQGAPSKPAEAQAQSAAGVAAPSGQQRPVAGAR